MFQTSFDLVRLCLFPLAVVPRPKNIGYSRSFGRWTTQSWLPIESCDLRHHTSVMGDVTLAAKNHTSVIVNHTCVIGNHTGVITDPTGVVQFHTSVKHDHTCVVANHTSVIRVHTCVIETRICSMSGHTSVMKDRASGIDCPESRKPELLPDRLAKF